MTEDKDYRSNIPLYTPSFEEISKQMRVNQEIIMKEITEHVDKQIERLKFVERLIPLKEK